MDSVMIKRYNVSYYLNGNETLNQSPALEAKFISSI